MSVTDTDYSILMTKLEALEHRIKKLEKNQKPTPVDVPTQEPFIKYDDILAVL